jgi:hypothetical protein
MRTLLAASCGGLSAVLPAQQSKAEILVLPVTTPCHTR